MVNWIYLGKYDDVELNALIIVVYQPPKSILRLSVSAALTATPSGSGSAASPRAAGLAGQNAIWSAVIRSVRPASLFPLF
jgi:hypothetical protein